MALSIQLFAILVFALFFIILMPQKNIWKVIIFFFIFVPSSAQGLISGKSYSTSGILNISMVGYIVII